MTPDIEIPRQDPCDWCLNDSPALLLCQCRYDCGEEDCAASDARSGAPVLVPEFDLAIAERIQAIEETSPPVPGLPTIDDPDVALDRVLALHSKCGCKTCVAAYQRPCCAGCTDFWPCRTVNAIRGFLDYSVPTTDSSIA